MAGEDPVHPGRPFRGRPQRRPAHLRGGGHLARRAAQRRPRHHGGDQRGARVQGRARRPHHHPGLRPDPAPRAVADARPAGRLDHHDQARPAGLAGRHARGDRADGRARRDARPGRPRAGRAGRPRPHRLGRGVAHRQPHQRVRRRPPRARDRRDRGGGAPRLPGHDLVRRAAGVPRVRADADRVHELVRAADGGPLRRPPAELAARAGGRHRNRHPALGRGRHDARRDRPQPGLRGPLGPERRRGGRALRGRPRRLPEHPHVRHGRDVDRRLALPGGRADDRARDHDRPVPDQDPVDRRAHGGRRRRLDRARAGADRRAARRTGVGRRRARTRGLRPRRRRPRP